MLKNGIFRQWNICPDLGNFSQIFIRLMELVGWMAVKIGSPDWFVFQCNVLELCADGFVTNNIT